MQRWAHKISRNKITKTCEVARGRGVKTVHWKMQNYSSTNSSGIEYPLFLLRVYNSNSYLFNSCILSLLTFILHSLSFFQNLCLVKDKPLPDVSATKDFGNSLCLYIYIYIHASYIHASCLQHPWDRQRSWLQLHYLHLFSISIPFVTIFYHLLMILLY